MSTAKTGVAAKAWGKQGMRLAFWRGGAVLAAVAALAGCVSLGGKVPEQLITLTPSEMAPAGEIGGGKGADALLVLDPETDRRLDVQRVPVQIDDATVAYLKNAMWVERPARQFRRLLAESIRAHSRRLVLETGDTGAVVKQTLAGRLDQMGYDARSQSVVVRFDALRTNADGTLSERRFESQVPGVSPSAEAVAPALNKAANDVAKQVAEWVG